MRRSRRHRLAALGVLDQAEAAGLTLVPQDDRTITIQHPDGLAVDPVLAQEIGRYELILHDLLTEDTAETRAQARATDTEPPTDPGDEFVAPAPLRTPAHGRGRLRVGNPTNRGRPRAEFRRKMRAIATDPAALGHLTEIARGTAEGVKARDSVSALRFAAEYGGLKPAETVNLRGLLGRIDFSQLPDAVVERLAAGEHPLAVLSSAGLLSSGEDGGGGSTGYDTSGRGDRRVSVPVNSSPGHPYRSGRPFGHGAASV